MFLSSCGVGDGFRIEGGKVVYERPWNTGHGTQVIDVDADAKTFEVLGGDNMTWARDNKHIFNEHHILVFFDRDSFEVLNDDFGKDDQTVVCGIEPIIEADTVTFKVKEFTDETGRKVILGIDKNAAYLPACGTRRISDSIKDLKPIKDNFYKDKTTVSWGSKILPNANPKTFEIFNGGKYSTDGEHVYYFYDLVEGADPQTFEVIGRNEAKDKNYKYEFEFEDKVE